MASPQVENGYTRIANELLEAMMRFPFSKNESRVVLSIIRLTYGKGKKQVNLSHNDIAKMTSLSRPRVTEAVANLVRKLVLKREIGTESGTKYKQPYGINKNYDTWQPKLVRKVGPKIGTESGTKIGTESGTKKSILPLYERKERKAQSIKKWTYKVKRPIPSDFYLTESLKSYGEKLLTKHGLDIDLEEFTEGFILKCKSKGYKYKDYIATWQTWLRRQIEWDLEKKKQTHDVEPNYGVLDDGFKDDIK